MISDMLVLYNCAVVKVVFVVHLRIVSMSFVFSKTWSINPLKPFRTCQSISDKNDICLVIVYFVLLFVCLFAFFFMKMCILSGLESSALSNRPSCLLKHDHDHDHDHAFLGTGTTVMQRRPREAHTLDFLRTKHLITKSPFHLIPEQGMLIVSVSLRSH